MTLIIISVAFSLVLLAMMYGASREGAGHVVAVSILGGFFCMLFAAGVGFIAVFLQCVITLVLAILCWPFRVSPKILFGCCLLAAVLANAFSIRVGMTRVQALQNLREQYPVISLKDRLAYETRRTAHPELKTDGLINPEIGGTERSTQPPLSLNVANRLDQFEQQGRSPRDYSLELLHNRTHEEFVFAQGFGITRMRGVHPEYIELPEEPPIPLPEKQEYEPSRENDDKNAPVNELAMAQPAPPQTLLMEVHDAGINDFLDPNRFGHVENIDRVIGFARHQFGRMPLNGPPPRPWGPDSPAWVNWRIQRLELVSLLKHDAPRVYVSDHLPRMDELDDAKIRPLDAFESVALPKLRTDQDLVVDESAPGRILMLGALRAGNDCLKCHTVKRGELLGAFSYELVRTSPEGQNRPAKLEKPEL